MSWYRSIRSRSSRRPLDPRHSDRPATFGARLCLETLEDRIVLNAPDFSLIGQQLSDEFHSFQTALHNTLDAAGSIPVLGKQLGDNDALKNVVAQFDKIGTTLEGVQSQIDQASNLSEADVVALLRSNLFSLLDPARGTFAGPKLGDLDSDKSVTDQDVVITPNVDADGSWEFKFLLHQDLVSAAAPLNFDLGLGKFLPLQTTGGVNLKVGVDYLFDFTADPASQTLQILPTNLHQALNNPDLPDKPLALSISAGLSDDFTATARLANLLRASATNIDTKLTGNFGIDFTGGDVSVSLNAKAHVGLRLACDFAADSLPFNPAVGTNLSFDWTFSDSPIEASNAPADEPSTLGNLGTVEFSDVTLQVDGLIGSFLGTVVKDVQAFTKPLQPIVDLVNTEIPGLNKLGIHLTLRDVIKAKDPDVIAAVDVLDQINKLTFTSGASGGIVLGDIKIDGLRDEANSGDVEASDADVSPDLDQQKQDELGSTLDELPSKVGSNEKSAFQFPMLDDPIHNLFPLLLGHDVTLFTFTMPDIHIGIPIPEIPIVAIPPLAGLFLQPNAGFDVNFKMGYDTSGLRELVEDVSQNHVTDVGRLTKDVSDGFFIDNTKVDGHYATSFEFTGGVDATVKAVFLKVSGGLGTIVSIHPDPNLEDEQHHVRLGKLLDVIDSGGVPVGLSGEVFFTLDFSVILPTQFGDVPLVHVNIAHLTILEFDDRPQAAQPVSDGQTLYLHQSAYVGAVKVKMNQHNTPDGSDPQAYTKVIEVDYPDHHEEYPIVIYHHTPNGVVGTDLAHYNLIAMDGQPEQNLGDGNSTSGDPLTPSQADSPQTVLIQDVQGDSEDTPLNAVLIGGDGNDDLEYHGRGRSLIIGGGGSNRLLADDADSPEAMLYGNTIDPDKPFNLDFTVPDNVRALIDAQMTKSTGGFDSLEATTAHNFLEGGDGTNHFYSDPSATFVGGSGANDFSIQRNLQTPATTGVPATLITDPNADNTLILDWRTNNAGDLKLRAESDDNGAFLHVTGDGIDVSARNLKGVSVLWAGGTLDVGDLSSLGDVGVAFLETDKPVAPTHVILRTPQDGSSDLEVKTCQHNTGDEIPSGLVVQHTSGPGASIDMLNLQSADDVTIELNGGHVAIEDLSAAHGALLNVDGRARLNSVANVVTAALPGGVNLHAGDDGNGGTLFDWGPRFDVLGSQAQDGLDLTVASTFFIGGPAADQVSVRTATASRLIADSAAGEIQPLVVDPDNTNPFVIILDFSAAAARATDNQLTLDAANLKGRLHVAVQDLDAAHLFQAVSDDQEALGLLPVDFGDTLVTLSAVNTSGTVTIDGAANAAIADPRELYGIKLNALPSGTNVVRKRLPETVVTVGTGKLSAIQGDVAVHTVRLDVNDSAGAASNVLTLTSHSLTGWAGPVTLSFDVLHGELAIAASPADRFDVESTPASITQTAISNTATSGTPADVYVMGLAAPLSVHGDYALTIGRRLHADGSVEAVGSVKAITGANSMDHPFIFFDYTGTQTTSLVLDQSSDDADLSSSGGGVFPSFNLPHVLLGNDVGGSRVIVSYGPNTEVFYHTAKGAKGTFFVRSADNPAIHFTDSTPANNSGVGATVELFENVGPVYVEGNGCTHVMNGDDFQDLSQITGDVFINRASLSLVATSFDAAFPNAVLTATSLTGVTPGTFHFADLSGELLNLFGVGFVTVQDTPAGSETHVTGPDVTVLGTTGTLEITSNGTIHVGNGSLTTINGDLRVNSGSLTLDASNDLSRTVVMDGGALTGLAPATIRNFADTAVIRGGAGSQYTVRNWETSATLYAGENSSADVTLPSALDVIGAADLTIHDGIALDSFPTVINIRPDPARPTDPFNLTIDYSGQAPDKTIQIGASAGMGTIVLADVNPFAPLPNPFGTHAPREVHFQSDVGHLTVNAIPNDVAALTVTGSGAGGVVIHSSSMPVVIGDAGSAQGIQGKVEIVDQDTTKPHVSVTIDDSADTTGRSVTLASLPPDTTEITGLAPAAIDLSASLVDFTVSAGSGGNDFRVTGTNTPPMTLHAGGGVNTLQGPDANSTYDLTGSDSGTLNAMLVFDSVKNLVAGSGADNILIHPATRVSGSLDGGDGIDTLDYTDYGPYVFDPTTGGATAISGPVSSVERAIPDQSPGGGTDQPSLSNPGDQSNQRGDAVSVSLSVSGMSVGEVQFSAIGLPPALRLQQTGPKTAVITGTISTDADVSTTYRVQVRAGDLSTSFSWVITAPATVPHVAISSAPNALSNERTPHFTFTSDAPGVFQYALDGGDFLQSDGSADPGPLADGQHTIQVRLLGQSQSEPATYTWVIDSTPPAFTSVPTTLNVTAVSALGVIASYPDVTATDAHGPVTITYDPKPGSILLVGTTTVTATATDAAGNVSTATFQVVVSAAQDPIDAAVRTIEQRFVVALYKQLLERPASLREFESGAIDAWVNEMGKAGRVGMIREFEKTNEYRHLQVTKLFKTHLKREPEQAALDSATAFLAAGGSIDEVEAAMIASAEYAALHGGDVKATLESLYFEVFDREIDADGLSSSKAALLAGVGLHKLAAAKLASKERHLDLIFQIYSKQLSRKPTIEESAGWVAQLDNNVDPAEVTAEMLGDPGDECFMAVTKG